MSWIDSVKIKLKRKNQILFSKNSEFLQDLLELLQEQNHRVIALWAFDLASETIAKLAKKYPDEMRPKEALDAVKDWSSSKIKMKEAKKKILSCHAFAKEIENKEDIAMCHAVGQACGVVHTVTHAIGYPIYDLTSIIYKNGIDNCTNEVEARKQEYIDKLIYWSEHINDYKGDWAEFMLK